MTLAPPAGELVVSYGGGVNSAAMLLALHEHDTVPRAITMADPGSERAETIRYRDEVMRPWCRSHGFPKIEILERRVEGQSRPRAWRLETLEEECLRIGSLPSVAYGWKRCSAKYKAEPQRWWTERQPWAIAAWERGEKIVRAIGYDLDESRRVDKARNMAAWKSAVEEKRFGYWYPLFDLGLDREDCISLIKRHGMTPPPKSACTFCPNNTLSEWRELRRNEPEAFARAVSMSRNATVQSEAVGLMRCNRHGQRALHVFADGGYPNLGAGDEAHEMPCECAT